MQLPVYVSVSNTFGLSSSDTFYLEVTTANEVVFNIADLGAEPEDATSTDTALEVFKTQAALLDPETKIILEFPAGLWQYTVNDFPRGFKYFTVRGAGLGITFLQNVAGPDPNWFEQAPMLAPNDYFGDPDYSLNYGYLIDTVEAGQTIVNLKNIAFADEFYVGRWVLVYSYDQQWGGYPPNIRYYDWAKVVKIEGTKIYLDTPVRFKHQDDFPFYSDDELEHDTPLIEDGAEGEGPTSDGTRIVGPARICPIDRPEKPVGEHYVYRDFTITPNPYWEPVDNQTLHLRGCINVDVINVYSPSFEASTVKNLNFKNVKWLGAEIDKIIDRFTCEDCDVESLRGVSGEQFVHFIRGRVGTTNNLCARHLQFDDTLFNGGLTESWPPMLNMDGSNSVESVILNRCTFENDIGVTIQQPISVSGLFVIGTQGLELVSSSRVRIDFEDFSGYFPNWKAAGEGWGIGHSVKVNGTWQGKVTNITGDGDYIYVDFADTTLTNGDEIYVAMTQHLEMHDCIGTGWLEEYFDNIPEVVWDNNT